MFIVIFQYIGIARASQMKKLIEHMARKDESTQTEKHRILDLAS